MDRTGPGIWPSGHPAIRPSGRPVPSVLLFESELPLRWGRPLLREGRRAEVGSAGSSDSPRAGGGRGRGWWRWGLDGGRREGELGIAGNRSRVCRDGSPDGALRPHRCQSWAVCGQACLDLQPVPSTGVPPGG